MDEKPVSAHLTELKNRLRNYLVVFGLAVGATFWKIDTVLGFFESDLGLELFSLKVQEAFYVQLKVALVVGFIATFPFAAYQFYRYARPGLKEREWKALRLMLLPAVLMFYIGVGFGYEVVAQYALAFFKSVTASSGFEAVWGLQASLDTILRLSLITGILFELPVGIFALGMAGIIDAHDLAEYRNYVTVALLLVSAALTPPDIVSQVVVVGPLILMYIGTEKALRVFS